MDKRMPNFVYSTVAANGTNHVGTFVHCITGKFGSMTGIRRLTQFIVILRLIELTLNLI